MSTSLIRPSRRRENEKERMAGKRRRKREEIEKETRSMPKAKKKG
jgi:hypothetical protein